MEADHISQYLTQSKDYKNYVVHCCQPTEQGIKNVLLLNIDVCDGHIIFYNPSFTCFVEHSIDLMILLLDAIQYIFVQLGLDLS